MRRSAGGSFEREAAGRQARDKVSMRRSAGGSFEQVPERAPTPSSGGLNAPERGRVVRTLEEFKKFGTLSYRSQCAGAREGRSNKENHHGTKWSNSGLNAPERGRVVRTQGR